MLPTENIPSVSVLYLTFASSTKSLRKVWILLFSFLLQMLSKWRSLMLMITFLSGWLGLSISRTVTPSPWLSIEGSYLTIKHEEKEDGYISQLVRYARICTSKIDFINRLRGLSLRLRQQGFETNRLQNSFNKFVNRHGLIVEKYGAALREMRLAIQA